MPESEQRDDHELVRRAKDGCEEAFTAIYRRHQRAVYRFAVHMSGSAEVAEEVTQEVFLALIREPEKWAPARGPLEAYLHGIARNHVLRALERDRRYVANEEAEVGLEADALTGMLAGERVAQLRKAVLSLPDVYREALVLCDLEGMDYESAARRMGCPAGTVRSRLSRARGLVAGKLKGMKGCAV